MKQRGANETTEAAWMRVVGRLGGAKNVQGVGRSEYVAELAPTLADPNARLTVNDEKTTQNALQFEQNLLARGSLTSIKVSPFGMVFGLRDATDNWELALVKNANYSYRSLHAVTKKRFVRSNKTVTVERGEVRQPLFFNADGSSNLNPQPVNTTDQAFNHCVALGFKTFFPGVGAVQMHNFNQINMF